MPTELRVNGQVREMIRCPRCSADVVDAEVELRCVNSGCGTRFPIVNGIPVLLNEEASVYSISQVLQEDPSLATTQRKAMLLRWLPSLGKNIKAAANYRRFAETLANQSASPRVLIIGGRVLGEGMDWLANESGIELVETDIRLGPRTQIICDAHNIPFADKSFDGVVIQAVLQYAVDPDKCADEIHRVLGNDGIVYVETPFMQQVMDNYDFIRFTHLGQRRLFRRFAELDSGVACGPGMALAWSYLYFLLSFSRSSRVRQLLRMFAIATSFYLKWFDRYLVDKPGAFDAASGYYFMGRKTQSVLSDGELIRLYKGAHPIFLPV